MHCASASSYVKFPAKLCTVIRRRDDCAYKYGTVATDQR